jgi:spermidine/putrescine transport system ATP-binding protein
MVAGFGVELENVWVQFGGFVAVRDASVRIEPGEFFSFLGPSGCGKTTILRTVSGFLEPSRGAVRIDGRDMAGVGPNRRPTALIFQNLALFPLMRVWENIAFALEVKGAGVAERRKRADELLELIALPGQGDKLVHELSGGQKQRVAIARALCAEPRVLLLDEPLSALDLKLRQHMRSELRAIQRRVGLTFIYITHDQGEALTMSDHVAVMREGVIEQIADGRTIYDDPASAFVASFVGENNAFSGPVTAVADGTAEVATEVGSLRARVATAVKARLKPGDRAMIFIRPEALRVADGGGDGATAREDQIAGRVTAEEFEGPNYHLHLEAASGVPIKTSLVNQGVNRASGVGAELTLGFDPMKAVVLPAGELAEEE